jgi:hypothetical protein
VRPGGTIVYPLTVTNLDPDPAENVVIKNPTNPDLVRGRVGAERVHRDCRHAGSG